MADLGDLLATTIAYKRKKQIEAEFFQKVSEKTYKKWFVKPYKDGEPFLDAARHGGFFQINGDDVSYYMLKRKYYTMYKSGHHMYPRKKQIEKTVSFAKQLMHMGFDSEVKKTKRGDEIVLSLGYSTLSPADYKNTKIALKYYHGIQIDDSFTKKEGRTSSLDKLLVDSVREWSYDNDLLCTIELQYGGDA